MLGSIGRIESMINMREAMIAVMDEDYEVSPRGLKIKETINLSLTVSPVYPFQLFTHRKYNISYFLQEMRWKLGASRMDDSIKNHASMWESVQNPDGSFNSNYGQYWFGDQMGLYKVVNELIRDRDSRRAVIPMLRSEHLSPETVDTVCTESITFLIRQSKLHCVVHMRSSDQIFGLGTDMPTFSVLQLLIYGLLKSVYTNLMIGDLTITAASSHIYERHWTMVRNIIEEDFSTWPDVSMPIPQSPEEVMQIIAFRGNTQLPVWGTGFKPMLRFLYG